MPKLNDELSPSERLSAYSRLVDFSKEMANSAVTVLSVHPRDRKLAGALEGWKEIALAPQMAGNDPLGLTREGIRRLSSACLIISDYFGAHVFRANALFGKPVFVDPSTALHRAIHPHLRGLLKEFLDLDLDSPERESISKAILGWDYRRSSEELRDMLFRPSMNRTKKKIFVAGYKTSRRIGVRLRQSSFWGQSPVSKWWEQRILRPKWESRFPPLDEFGTGSSPRGLS